MWRVIALLVCGCTATGADSRPESAPPPPAPAARAAPPSVAAVPPGASPAAAAPGEHWPAPSWLCTRAVGAVSRNRGGSSITFRLLFEGGEKAAFKPDQEAGFSRFRAELAAYQVSELLGYGRVPPSCERALPDATLRAAAQGDPELQARLGRELRRTPAGNVRGAAILWIDGIRPLELRPAEVPGHPMATVLSDMILFDELIANWDRWSGGNIFTDASGERLVLIDNAAGFGPIGPPRRAKMDAVLGRAAAPSEAFVSSLRRLQRQDVSRVLAGAGYGETQVDDLMARRDRILARLASSGSAAPR